VTDRLARKRHDNRKFDVWPQEGHYNKLKDKIVCGPKRPRPQSGIVARLKKVVTTDKDNERPQKAAPTTTKHRAAPKGHANKTELSRGRFGCDNKQTMGGPRRET